MAKEEVAEVGAFGASVDYLRECWKELKKVHFLRRHEALQQTAVVLLMIVLFGVFFGLADYLLGHGMQIVLNLK